MDTSTSALVTISWGPAFGVCAPHERRHRQSGSGSDSIFVVPSSATTFNVNANDPTTFPATR